MNRSEIIEKLRGIIISADEGRGLPAALTEDSRIMQDLGFTSIGMLYIAIAVEETFGIRFENVGVSDFVTLGDLVSYIEGKTR